MNYEESIKHGKSNMNISILLYYNISMLHFILFIMNYEESNNQGKSNMNISILHTHTYIPVISSHKSDHVRHAYTYIHTYIHTYTATTRIYKNTFIHTGHIQS